MRIHLIFGSQSDKDIYEPLQARLNEISGVRPALEICSAHRQPDRLRKLIQDHPVDLYIAGAGLAAHLPGVIASQTSKPVIGIPCLDILQGLDALLSIVQMPRGVPVLTAGVGHLDSVVRFVRWYADNRGQPPVIKVVAPAWAQSWVQKLQGPLEQIGWDFVKHNLDVDHPPGVFPLVLADLLNPADTARIKPGPDKPGTWLGVPILDQLPYSGELSQLGLLTQAGGLWLGVNNITNLQIALLQLWPVGNKERDLMNELRGGQKQNAG